MENSSASKSNQVDNKDGIVTNNTEKTYINLYFFKITINIFFTYLYLLASIFLNIINRVLYQKYNFKFNFTLMFIQQLFCAIFFTFMVKRHKQFEEKMGPISFNEFKKNKYLYFFFCSLFSMNYLSSFIANQKVNTAMFLNLRKYLTVMNYLYDLFINGKNLPNYFTQSVLLISSGAFLSGYEDLSSEAFGYLIVFANNAFSVLYGQISESFSKTYKIPNIKLLIYNSYLTTPLMFLLIFASGEYIGVVAFLKNNWQTCGFGFIFFLTFSCFFTIVLNSSYFISNEMNSSLFTQLLSNCKDIFITGIAAVTLKDFSPTALTIFGVILSTSGALVFSVKSIYENMQRTYTNITKQPDTASTSTTKSNDSQSQIKKDN